MKNKSKKWWFWILAVLLFPFLCLYGIYRLVINYRTTGRKVWLVGVVPLALVSLFGFVVYAGAFSGPNSDNKTETAISSYSSSFSSSSVSTSTKPAKSISKSTTSSSSSKVAKKVVASSSSSSTAASTTDILNKLNEYTNAKSAGPTGNYYWENGSAKLSGFENLKAGEYSFNADDKGRSGVARAILTYSQFEASKGSRQGQPLDPPAWPSSNPKIAITFSLTGRTYHGYLYNRSHSIADSLLGEGSYTSQYNFTTGTRSQNVGANQNGGMRYAEELAEDFWKANPNTSATINYQTTPVYNANETIPRGSIVDIKSSDNTLNTEVVVINSAEGLEIDYASGTPISSTTQPVQSEAPKVSSSQAVEQAPVVTEPSSQTVANDNSYTTEGGWSIAAPGMVFVSESNKYYSSVTNPSNYQYMSQAEASNIAQPAQRGNQYARP
ncbi:MULTISPECIES: DNA/RNA non-specific endonuclease [unclassified Lactococcus]|uniref:DNA/RNA non-specific endonuclease n=2 Tax=Lactococcus TaxID=1357 RepID=UPI00143087C8|nr:MULTISPECIES: DNA/RNA non-specific endonuclease [unclassified Lactococcus]KAF6607983.1 DNA/RNA non-specific endonuclease [Lactococcus sp. EKM201L]KAF6611812.1 DNA/RNA non-specific endonuclease [Lactococcus sp. EKM203L]KAF6640326.1 DNA/RNA non-specific endonuclease [Lactococcus sp. EKM501L]KAF6642613.1 DNA/RNA non-specific endonuclease [Lactococcus sp. EKM502L]KAF6650777.1 DNA/RNA non-specific endonuclease [Lactococcus sp. EKM101L]